MLVILMMSVLLAMAVPNWMRAGQVSRAKACSLNLKRIEEAKEMWALDHGKSGAALPSEADLYGPAAYVRAAPVCPDHGTYAIADLLTQPTCSHGGSGLVAHALPDDSRIASASGSGQPAGGTGVLIVTVVSAGVVLSLFAWARLRAAAGELALGIRSRWTG